MPFSVRHFILEDQAPPLRTARYGNGAFPEIMHASCGSIQDQAHFPYSRSDICSRAVCIPDAWSRNCKKYGHGHAPQSPYSLPGASL